MIQLSYLYFFWFCGTSAFNILHNYYFPLTFPFILSLFLSYFISNFYQFFNRLHQLNVKKFRDRQQELKKDVKNVLLKKSSITEHSSVPRVVTEFVSFSLQPLPMKEKVIDRKVGCT